MSDSVFGCSLWFWVLVFGLRICEGMFRVYIFIYPTYDTYALAQDQDAIRVERVYWDTDFGCGIGEAEYGPQVKRQRILDCKLSFEFRAHPKRDTVGTIQETFEQIMKEDPRFMLDTVKRTQRRSSTGEGPETRAAKEQHERDRYALELAGILQEADEGGMRLEG